MFSKRYQTVPQPPTYMIHRNPHFGKIFRPVLKHGRKIYDGYIKKLDLFEVKCNDCQCRGECIRYGRYDRGYFLFPEDADSNERIFIQRVLCKACGVTHAILPEEIVPYAQYSIIFMLLVLEQYFLRPETHRTVQEICDEFRITPPLLYRWKKAFKKDKDKYLGVLESDKYTELEALSWLKDLPNYGKGFAAGFLEKTERMPMQTHRNPTNTRRPELV